MHQKKRGSRKIGRKVKRCVARRPQRLRLEKTRKSLALGCEAGPHAQFGKDKWRGSARVTAAPGNREQV